MNGAALTRERMMGADFVARLDYRRRERELRELAAEEGIVLPFPVHWIVALELAGYVVDLVTGEWTPADELLYSPTAQAQQAAGGAQ